MEKILYSSSPLINWHIPTTQNRAKSVAIGLMWLFHVPYAVGISLVSASGLETCFHVQLNLDKVKNTVLHTSNS